MFSKYASSNDIIEAQHDLYKYTAMVTLAMIMSCTERLLPGKLERLIDIWIGRFKSNYWFVHTLMAQYYVLNRLCVVDVCICDVVRGADLGARPRRNNLVGVAKRGTYR
jgi:hypothetical protein